MSTYFPSSHDITRKWFVVDASGKTLGRLATEAASMLAGKKNPKYTPFIDMGDHVIVVNAEKIVLTGLKSQQKVYRRYTGFPGGLGGVLCTPHGAPPGENCRRRHQRHAAQEQDGPPDGNQAQSLPGR
jgi:ribosomal protein L13